MSNINSVVIDVYESKANRCEKIAKQFFEKTSLIMDALNVASALRNREAFIMSDDGTFLFNIRKSRSDAGHFDVRYVKIERK